MQQNTTDIYCYTVFANIDNRDGTITGHQMFLTKEQMSAIEDIILTAEIRVEECSSYELDV